MYSLKYNISILHMYLLVIEYRCQIKDIYIFYGGNYDNRMYEPVNSSDLTLIGVLIVPV